VRIAPPPGCGMPQHRNRLTCACELC
jgi:hypothetical protein